MWVQCKSGVDIQMIWWSPLRMSRGIRCREFEQLRLCFLVKSALPRVLKWNYHGQKVFDHDNCQRSSQLWPHGTWNMDLGTLIFHVVPFLFSHVPSHVPMKSTSGEYLHQMSARLEDRRLLCACPHDIIWKTYWGGHHLIKSTSWPLSKVIS
jgi:hypothetical protein